MRAFAPVLAVLAIGLVVLLYVRMSQGWGMHRREMAQIRKQRDVALDGLQAVRDEVQLQIDGSHPDLYLLRNLVQDSLANVANPNRKELNR